MGKQLPQEYEFSKCPVCGSTERLAGKMAQSVRDKGMGRPEWDCYVQGLDGVVADPMKRHQMLIGTSMPAYRVFTDICLKCGTIYACKVLITSAVASPAREKMPANIPSPGLVRGN